MLTLTPSTGTGTGTGTGTALDPPSEPSSSSDDPPTPSTTSSIHHHHHHHHHPGAAPTQPTNTVATTTTTTTAAATASDAGDAGSGSSSSTSSSISDRSSTTSNSYYRLTHPHTHTTATPPDTTDKLRSRRSTVTAAPPLATPTAGTFSTSTSTSSQPATLSAPTNTGAATQPGAATTTTGRARSSTSSFSLASSSHSLTQMRDAQQQQSYPHSHASSSGISSASSSDQQQLQHQRQQSQNQSTSTSTSKPAALAHAASSFARAITHSVVAHLHHPRRGSDASPSSSPSRNRATPTTTTTTTAAGGTPRPLSSSSPRLASPSLLRNRSASGSTSTAGTRASQESILHGSEDSTHSHSSASPTAANASASRAAAAAAAAAAEDEKKRNRSGSVTSLGGRARGRGLGLGLGLGKWGASSLSLSMSRKDPSPSPSPAAAPAPLGAMTSSSSSSFFFSSSRGQRTASNGSGISVSASSSSSHLAPSAPPMAHSRSAAAAAESGGAGRMHAPPAAYPNRAGVKTRSPRSFSSPTFPAQPQSQSQSQLGSGSSQLALPPSILTNGSNSASSSGSGANTTGTVSPSPLSSHSPAPPTRVLANGTLRSHSPARHAHGLGSSTAGAMGMGSSSILPSAAAASGSAVSGGGGAPLFIASPPRSATARTSILLSSGPAAVDSGSASPISLAGAAGGTASAPAVVSSPSAARHLHHQGVGGGVSGSGSGLSGGGVAQSGLGGSVFESNAAALASSSSSSNAAAVAAAAAGTYGLGLGIGLGLNAAMGAMKSGSPSVSGGGGGGGGGGTAGSASPAMLSSSLLSPGASPRQRPVTPLAAASAAGGSSKLASEDGTAQRSTTTAAAGRRISARPAAPPSTAAAAAAAATGALSSAVSRPGGLYIPPELLEGEILNKVTPKKMRDRKFWIELDTGRMMWDSKTKNCINIELINEIRVGADALHAMRQCGVPTRYASRFISIHYNREGTYKAIHLVADPEKVQKWRRTLLDLQQVQNEILQGFAGETRAYHHHLSSSSSGSMANANAKADPGAGAGAGAGARAGVDGATVRPLGSWELFERREEYWLREHWRLSNPHNKEFLDFEEMVRFCRRLGISAPKSHLREHFVAADLAQRGALSLRDCFRFMRFLNRRSDIERVFELWADLEVEPDEEMGNVHGGVGADEVEGDAEGRRGGRRGGNGRGGGTSARRRRGDAGEAGDGAGEEDGDGDGRSREYQGQGVRRRRSASAPYPINRRRRQAGDIVSWLDESASANAMGMGMGLAVGGGGGVNAHRPVQMQARIQSPALDEGPERMEASSSAGGEGAGEAERVRKGGHGDGYGNGNGDGGTEIVQSPSPGDDSPSLTTTTATPVLSPTLGGGVVAHAIEGEMLGNGDASRTTRREGSDDSGPGPTCGETAGGTMVRRRPRKFSIGPFLQQAAGGSAGAGAGAGAASAPLSASTPALSPPAAAAAAPALAPVPAPASAIPNGAPAGPSAGTGTVTASTLASTAPVATFATGAGAGAGAAAAAAAAAATKEASMPSFGGAMSQGGIRATASGTLLAPPSANALAPAATIPAAAAAAPGLAGRIAVQQVQLPPPPSYSRLMPIVQRAVDLNRLGISETQFGEFLRIEQKLVDLHDDDVRALFNKYRSLHSGAIHLKMFTAFLMSPDNALVVDQCPFLIEAAKRRGPEGAGPGGCGAIAGFLPPSPPPAAPAGLPPLVSLPPPPSAKTSESAAAAVTAAVAAVAARIAPPAPSSTNGSVYGSASSQSDLSSSYPAAVASTSGSSSSATVASALLADGASSSQHQHAELAPSESGRAGADGMMSSVASLSGRSFATSTTAVESRVDEDEVRDIAIGSGGAGAASAVLDDQAAAAAAAASSSPRDQQHPGAVAPVHTTEAHTVQDGLMFHDMTRPLSEYFISSSHNTYLIGSQYKGDSTIEGYIRALKGGARCVEIDCHRGKDGSPIVTHAMTMVTAIPFVDVIETLGRYAFVSNPYPLIVSLELHIDIPMQDEVVRILRERLGGMLLSGPLPGRTEDGRLPSPEELKGKILIKAKVRDMHASENKIVKVEAGQKGEVTAVVVEDTDSDSTGTETNESEGGSETFLSTIRRITGRRNRSNTHAHRRLSPNLAALLVYTTGVDFDGWSDGHEYKVEHMISMNEQKAAGVIKKSKEMLIRHNMTHLTRIWPSLNSLARAGSANFLPHDMWAAGCQLAAMNWQKPDLGMQLNNAMFIRNGKCGYVLKPEALRCDEQVKDANERLRFAIDITIISAQQLPRYNDVSRDKDKQSDVIDPHVALSIQTPESWGPQPASVDAPRGFFGGVSPPFGTPSGANVNGFDFEPPRRSTTTLSFAASTASSSPYVPSRRMGRSDSVSSVSSATGPVAAGKRTSRLRTHTIKGNGFNPMWDSLRSITLDVPAGDSTIAHAAELLGEEGNPAGRPDDIRGLSRGLLDMCFVKFEVLHDNQLDSSCLATSTVCLGSMLQGELLATALSA
ncbi:hypothetical protein OC844_001607 [Tilletia horrida]|nr:hypothetical protein OC844_001607 [Tilletia horrida]